MGQHDRRENLPAGCDMRLHHGLRARRSPTVNDLRIQLRTALLLILSVATVQTVEGQEVIRSTYTYKTIGDLRIRADVYRRPGEIVTPAILWIHGGALIMGNRRGLNAVQAEKYLDAGYTIISIDYRLAPQAKLNDIIEDLVDAYRWVRIDGPKLFRIDPNRIAVVGHSAGGYLTLMAGFRLNPRPAALVSFYGYGDIAGDWYSRPDPFYSRQPAVPKEEAYQAVGTQASSPRIKAGTAGGSTFTRANRRSCGRWRWSGTIPTRNRDYSIRCAQFATSRRSTRRRYFFTGTPTPTYRSSSPL